MSGDAPAMCTCRTCNSCIDTEMGACAWLCDAPLALDPGCCAPPRALALAPFRCCNS